MVHALVPLLGGVAPWLMGVLNVTPDSFSDGARFVEPEAALAHADLLTAAGADLIDVGGESTAPGRPPVGAEVELARLEPVVGPLVGRAVVSVDTYRARTAARCLELGARIVNDVSALRFDPDMLPVLRAHKAIAVLMYSKEPGDRPHASDRAVGYDDVALEIGDFLERRIEACLTAGIAVERLVADPGMGGFVSLDPAHSWRLLADYERLVERLAPVPVLVATSRKGFLGLPLAERDPLSQLTALVAAAKGAAMIRTHDVAMARQFLDAGRKMGIAMPAGRI